MKQIHAFFKLIRTLNLLFIAITQYLFQYFIVIPLFQGHALSLPLSGKYFWLLLTSSVLIAAAGYIINDYFDLNIDRVNKPEKLVVEKYIPRRWAIAWHLLLSMVGILIGIYIGWKINVFWVGLANTACVLTLWFYSTTFKKKLLTGNILISLLTAWVVLVVGFIHHYKIIAALDVYQAIDRSKLLRFTFLYAGFAFIISIVREVVKDIEDMEGDARYGCRTMPIVWGTMVSKVFSGTWLVVLLAVVLIVSMYMLQLTWWIPFFYSVALIFLPLLVVLKKLKEARRPVEFHNVSTYIKVVMFTGILSMAVIGLHH
ncbi:MAG TPA: geranylgeranylglycerol-phosphate geranylgeranyltransferase [Flavitalea sp.]|nr:geranylgeranylglycerol-phosphate geranylgeranyltransferase [Flavitalea sp.]